MFVFAFFQVFSLLDEFGWSVVSWQFLNVGGTILVYSSPLAVVVAAADTYAVEKLKALEEKYPYIKKPTEDVSAALMTLVT